MNIKLKQILRWMILGATLIFLAKTLKAHWLEVMAIRIDAVGCSVLAIATGVTLLAHIWAGWIWTWILQDLNQSVPISHLIRVYLKTNIAKYLPGNIWHHYGRIVAAKNVKVATGTATLSVLLEALLMAAAALIIVVIFGSELTTKASLTLPILQLLSLIIILCGIHPRCLNPVLNLLSKLKAKKSTTDTTTAINIKRYPLRPLLGELGFLTLRGMGFILTVFALMPLNASQIPLLLGAFSFAWLLGFVVPGAPGGLGVFEVTAIALLQNRFPSAAVIGAIALYRLISIMAETAGAGLAWLDERVDQSHFLP